jgi:hypothetical protein
MAFRASEAMRRRQGWHTFEILKPKTADFRKQFAHIVGQSIGQSP